VPTTLVAQADSAIGGKNAVNLPQGRNLVGTIHQPTVVVADVTTACQNREHGFRAGLSEIAKHALISRSDLLSVLDDLADDACGGDVDAVQQLVDRSVEIKADIVSRDERATGERMILNYGHTFGHAMDLVSGQLDDQGESVALGMMAAAHLARRQGRIGDDVVDRHHRLLSRLGLPTSGRFELEAMHRAWLRDKKYRHGVRFVVLNGLGQAEAGVTASADMLADVLHDLAS
jgi:3-dehydroquinate synthase/shikimate kinase/3-dehydroquinate synthase